MKLPNRIKTGGYASSLVSVFLIAAPSWKSTIDSPLLMACLITGIATSITGMALRWYSYQIDTE